jgi:murein DD-endopeptidase MepM/ murein hydrolase activator NlpD
MSRGRSLRDFANNGASGDEDSSSQYVPGARGADGRWDGGDSDEYGAYGDSDEYTGFSEARSGVGGALAPVYGQGEYLPALLGEDSGPVIVPGSGVSMGDPFVRRRTRPLVMRLTIVCLMICILVTGLFAVTPLSSNADSSLSSFQALSGVVVWNNTTGFFWYVAQSGDSLDSVAARFHIQIGGIYQLNGMYAGDELTVGKPYKVPTDPSYGATFRPPARTITRPTDGSTVFGNEWFTSFAGTPPPEASCGPNGKGNPPGYGLQSPNWSSYWQRGFSWYHNGVDLSGPLGNPIYAAQAGQVIWAGWDGTNGFGWSVVINHCNHLSTLYGHMEKIVVSARQNVKAGQVVGYEGATGWATGPHLHFSVLVDNQFVDPMPYFNYSVCAITHRC